METRSASCVLDSHSSDWGEGKKEVSEVKLEQIFMFCICFMGFSPAISFGVLVADAIAPSDVKSHYACA